MDISSLISVICCIFYNMSDVITISLVTVELPKILNPECNSNTTQAENLGPNNWTACESNPWEQPGIVIAAQNSSGLLFSVFIGYLISIYDSRYVFLAGLLIHASGSFILALNDAVFGGNFLLLVIGVFFDGFGGIVGAVTFTDIVRRIFPKDSTRCRLLNLVGLARVIGYASGFFLGSISYEYLGSVTTYVLISSMFVVQASAMTVSLCLDRNRSGYRKLDNEDEETRPIISGHYNRNLVRIDIKQKPKDENQNQPENPEPTKIDRSYYAIFTNLATMILCIQFFFTHFSVATVAATAPSRLQLQVGFTAVQNGLMTGLALANTFIIMVILFLFVKTNFVRVCCIMLFVTIEIIGLATYPFTWSFLFAMFSETCIHAARNALNSFGSSILMLITDNFHLDYGKANGVYILARYCSQSIGSFLSVFLLQAWGFTGLYFALVGCLVPVALASVIYLRLAVKQ